MVCIDSGHRVSKADIEERLLVSRWPDDIAQTLTSKRKKVRVTSDEPGDARDAQAIQKGYVKVVISPLTHILHTLQTDRRKSLSIRA